MATQAQIDASIAATHLRRRQQRDEQLRRNTERRERRERMAFPEYDGKLIGFVVKTRREKFKPFVGRVVSISGEDDALVSVIGTQPAQETLEEALAFLAKERDNLVLLLEKPVPSHGVMGHWLQHMLICQDTPSVET